MYDQAKPFKALADSNRLRILNLLAAKPMCVCEITSMLGLAVSTVSKHLSILREAGFITDKKDAKWVNYSLAADPDSPMVMNLIASLRREIFKDPQFVADRRRARTVNRTLLAGNGQPGAVPNKKHGVRIK